MTTYDLGQGVNLTHTVYDRDGALTAATVALTITRPDGTTFSPAPSLSNPSTGVYRAATFVPDMVGHWSFLWTISGTVTDVDDGAFTVQAVAVREYTDLTTVKDSLGKTSVDDRDDLIEQAIRSASRMIDERVGRRFYLDPTATARRLPASGAYLANCELRFRVPDIGATDGLVVEVGGPGAWTTVSAATYDTDPDTAPGDGRPITVLYGSPGWLSRSGRVRVTARWGWPAVPEPIVQATVLLATRLYRRKDSPQGVLGNAEWGSIRVSRVDPDVEALIAPYVIPLIA